MNDRIQIPFGAYVNAAFALLFLVMIWHLYDFRASAYAFAAALFTYRAFWAVVRPVLAEITGLQGEKGKRE